MTYALVLLTGIWLGWHLHRHWLKRQELPAPRNLDIRAGTTRCRAYTEVG